MEVNTALQKKREQPNMRRMRARNKSGTVTYIVQTANDHIKNQNEQPNLSTKQVQDQMNIQIRIEQEKVVAMLENIAYTAKDIDYRALDELNSIENEQSFSLKAFLNSLEMLAQHWGMIKKEKYAHRVAMHGHLDIYINEIPRATNDGKIFNIKTFVLSCKTPYMKTKDGTKVFISKEYSNGAGKLHLSFYKILDLIIRELNAKLVSINRDNNRGSIMAFFRTIFSSGQDGIFHPLFKETLLLRKIKKHIKIFELCIRNFEETYIAMIKDLQEKTFKMNLDVPFEKSIIMKKREGKMALDIGKTKFVDNQMFDDEGNLLNSLKNSFNQSMVGSVNSRIGSQYTQSIVEVGGKANCGGGGPLANITPMNHIRKAAHDDNSIKPTSSSQGPSRIKQTISPSTRGNITRSSRNSGFRPLQSMNNIDTHNIFKRKNEFTGSIVSTSSQPCLINQALSNGQKKTISPQIIKHNFRPVSNTQSKIKNFQLQNNTNDDLQVEYIDLNDDKENIYGNNNMLKASMSNFAFQTPNPHQNFINSVKAKFMATQTTGITNTSSQTPGTYVMNSAVATIINQQDYPQSTNGQKTRFPGDFQSHINMQQEGDCNNLDENRANYKNLMMNNRRVIKTSRNLFMNNSQSEVNENQGDSQKQRGSMHQEEAPSFQKHSGSNDNNYLQRYMQTNGQRMINNSNKEKTENSFENSSDSSFMDNDSNISVEERNEINQSSMIRASHLESRIEQINPKDLIAYNNLIEQFNY